MVSTELRNIVESMIFASEEEITPRQIKEIIDKGGLRISIAEVEESVSSLNDEYRSGNKPFEILKIAGGFSFATKKEYGRFIGKLFEDKQKKKLSQSALETLSIIAYKQPITRSEIEFIRGVNVDYIVNSLLERDLITITGRSETPGRPILYGSTKTFLKVLGLNSLEDLPKLKEINEILKNEEIEGITEADIELFNSVNSSENNPVSETSHQLELLTNENIQEEENADNTDYNETESSENEDDEIINEDLSEVVLTENMEDNKSESAESENENPDDDFNYDNNEDDTDEDDNNEDDNNEDDNGEDDNDEDDNDEDDTDDTNNEYNSDKINDELINGNEEKENNSGNE
ncbi:MAG: SMC-Scp complex subunit ScpB [Ignavibacteria bacterium]|nr:SMC-Scp complex subunit ScpB [Ignavibacteria bacterium]